jgi:hypothetical protein
MYQKAETTLFSTFDAPDEGKDLYFPGHMSVCVYHHNNQKKLKKRIKKQRAA